MQHEDTSETITLADMWREFWNGPITLAIIESEPEGSDIHEIVLSLGGFHTLMSFWGATGKLMTGSGLRHLWELIYSTNTVTHMLSD